jgi:hypothetical protein
MDVVLHKGNTPMPLVAHGISNTTNLKACEIVLNLCTQALPVLRDKTVECLFHKNTMDSEH